MQAKTLKNTLIRVGLAASVLLLGSGASYAQQVINLSASPATATMPDGSAVPMWGYTCGAVPTTGSTATCTALNPAVQALNTTPPTGFTVGSAWSPVVITVPTGQDLQINLTNNLSFTPLLATTANPIPTSLVIYGQLGGGLGTVGTGCTGGATCTPSPTHSQQGVTWAVVGGAGAGSPTFTPPPQGPRVQSWGTEVAASATPTMTTVATQ